MKKFVQILSLLACAFGTWAPAQTITNQPQSVTVNIGSSAQFTVGANGATSYQWQFDGTNISGATNSILALENLFANQAGNYAAVLNGGSITSSNAVLSIIPGTVVTFQLTGFPAGGTSNVTVQLFNHDKPVTVQNFLHYVTSGAFSNMFFDRDSIGFVLQGGDDMAYNRTNTSSPLRGAPISQYVGNSSIQPELPNGIQNEAFAGLQIHNDFGTIAMALDSTSTNSATSAFFFNLTNNSALLDSTSDGGPFVVFGRISGAASSNILEYFNDISNGHGAVPSAIIFDGFSYNTIPGLGSLPVNYIGTNAPGNANLLFCDFSLTQPAGATNLPSVTIASPGANFFGSNGLAITVQGTAVDVNNIGLASVRCDLIPLPAADGTLPNGGIGITNYALPTGTNWTVSCASVPPGVYKLGAQVQDEAGNLGPEVFVQPITVTILSIQGNGSVTVNAGSFSNLDATVYPFQTGSNYMIYAIPASNSLFGGWRAGGEVSLTPSLSFDESSASLFTVTFVSNTIPNGLNITSPTSNEIVTNVVFDITGTISNAPNPPVTITCQLYSTTTYEPFGSPLTTTNSPDWSVAATFTGDDSYVVEVTAVDAAGNTTIATQNFSVSLVPVIITPPQSLTVNAGSTAQFTVIASNALSYQWQFQGSNISGATASALALEDVSTNQVGAYTVIASSANVSVTSAPPALLTITNGTVIQFILSGMTNGNPSNIVNVELFDNDRPATVQNFLHYIRSGAYTNMFFDKCVTNSLLQGGGYGAADRTNTAPPLNGWSISNKFVLATNQSPPFPGALRNESGNGGFIHNRFGTLAMALAAGNTNSANSAFFFNLKDNSGSLDSQHYAVFGRIVDSVGTNVLQYFNTLNNNTGVATNGVILDAALGGTNRNLPAVPVNYSGTNPPANASLVFCDFQVPANTSFETASPTIELASPAPGAVMTNAHPVVQGTASDPVGIAQITCILTPQPAADTSLPNGGVSITNYAAGTTNWSVGLATAGGGAIPPGTYNLSVQAQNGAGNLSPLIAQSLIVSAIVTNGFGTVTVSNMDAVGYPFVNGKTYTVTETPGAGQVFLDWTSGATTVIAPQTSFPMSAGFVLTANFASNSLPNSINFTYPAPGQGITSNAFNITGTVSNIPSPPVTIVLQIDESNGFIAAGPFTNSATTDFSFPISGLPTGAYVVQAVATDQAGNTTAISENFQTGPTNGVQINIVGPGTVTGLTNGQPLIDYFTFQVTAIPASNGVFYGWSNSVLRQTATSPTETFINYPGLILTAIFLTNNASNIIAFTYPAPNGTVGLNPFYLTGTISNAPSAQITATIFQNGEELFLPLTATGTKTWSIYLGSLRAGQYTVVAQGVDPAGDSSVIQENFTVATNGMLRLSVAGGGTTGPYTNGQSLMLGTNFTLTATPGAGEAFYNWSDGAHLYFNTSQSFTMSYGLSLTATFIATNTIKGLTFTYPPANGYLRTNAFVLKGKIATTMKSANITCQFFQTNGLAVGPPMTTTGTNNWSIDVTNLPGGNYLVQAVATNEAGKTTVVSEKFSVYAFSAVQGTYAGLFLCTNQPVNATNSGFFTFTVSPYGVMTGKLEFPGYAMVPIYPLAFFNSGFTTGYAQFGTTEFHGAPLLATIFMDLSGDSDTAYGSIVSSSNGWSSELLCYRTLPKLSAETMPALGKYVISLQTTNQTNAASANGFASVLVAKNGKLAVSGMLPDDTKFSQSVGVSKEGIWPLYAVPTGVKTNGAVLGWETFTNDGSCSGQLYWYKGAKLGGYYTNGVGLATNFLFSSPGSNYLAPTVNTPYSIVFEGGALAAPLTNTLAVAKSGQFTVPKGTADKLKISLTPNGVLTGTFVNPNGNKTVHFSGAFFNPVQGGSGFVADVDGQTGVFTITPASP